METAVETVVTEDDTTLVETVAVDGPPWVDMTGKTTLHVFETDATVAAVEGTVVTVALFCLVDERLVPKEKPW